MNAMADKFFDSIKGKKVTFIGIGTSNLPLIKLFVEKGAKVTACDKKNFEDLGQNGIKAKEYGAELLLGENYLSEIDADIVFRSPGTPFYKDELVALRNKGVVLTSEMEVFFDLCPCRIIAVTGSDGKTTTTTIISEFLKAAGFNVHLGGNIGKPLLPEIESVDDDDCAVVELSSFQLISMRKSPDIAVVTNLAPNHLDIHKDMQEYIDSKKNIILHQNAFSKAVLNLDNEITNGFSESVRGQLAKFSVKENVSNGAFLDGDTICVDDDDCAVVELSSFQLISMRKSPDIAVVTNLAPNHLDIHKDMQEYIDSKKNIILHQNAFSKAVLNLDNEITNGFSESVRGQLAKFSVKENVSNGAFLDGDTICYNDYGKITRIMNIHDIKIPGMHNVENYLAAISAVWGLVDAETMTAVAKTFGGVAHRAEFVREVDGVKYYNDSIASSPTRTALGTLSLYSRKICIIAGGYDKHIPYEPLGPVINDKVKLLILLGDTAPKIEKAVKEASNYDADEIEIVNVTNMEEAVAVARERSTKGDIVSLSPASASFGLYKNFEERGNHFKSIVNALK